MTVFNHYLKITKTYIPMIIMYTIIFTFFAVVASTSSTNQGGDTFAITKPTVSIINNDEKSALIDTLTSYIEENAKIVDLNVEDEEDIKDALFFREVNYILIIPKSFTENFMQDLKPQIETMTVPDSHDATYLSMLLNRFLNIANLYVKSGMDENLLAANVKEDLKVTANVSMENEKENVSTLGAASYYYNFSNYTLIAVCVMVVAMVMNAFNRKNIKRRNIVSSIPYNKISRSLFLGNLCIMFCIWLLYVIMSVIIYGSSMFEPAGWLMILNSFVFAFTVLSIGFMLGSLVHNKDAINGIVNVVALGTSFTCGAFVPQEFLGEFVVQMSKVLPSYWFIRNNNLIANLTIFNVSNLQPIFINMIVVLLFGILFFFVTNLITKFKLKEN